MRRSISGAYLLRVVVLLVMLTAKCHAVESAWTRTDISIPLGGGVELFAELYMPVKLAPKALVIVVPGTGGLSDPYFDVMINRQEYDPDLRGGVTSALINAGYAVVFYNQRGYLPLRKCVAGRVAYERAVSFVGHCIDPALRGQVSLSLITSDTWAVFDAFSSDIRTRQLKQIALAWSEGAYHVAALVADRKINPVAIVSIGGPVGSLADTARYQLGREYFLALAEIAFSNCAAKSLAISDIFRCGGVHPTAAKYASLREMVGGGRLERQALPERRAYFSGFYRSLVEQYLRLPKNALMGGSLLGVSFDVGWAADYYRQIFAAQTSVLESLSQFKGTIFFLYGSEDGLVKVPLAGSCGASSSLNNCTVQILSGLGHGLEDDNGTPTQEALSMLIDDIENACSALSTKVLPTD